LEKNFLGSVGIMAFPGTYNFNYYKGDTFSIIVRPKDAVGDQFDLTGYTTTFTIASGRGSSPTSFYAGTAVINTVDDIVTATITSSVGNNLLPTTTWVYDIQITNGTIVYTLLTGNITVTDDVREP
jgi:hypothetical protein